MRGGALGPVRLRLLVINPDSSVSQQCHEAFSGSDVDILTATNEIKGLELFLHSRPQIVILDITGLPGSGVDALSRMLAVDPAVSVILLADQYSTSAAMNAIRLGATDFLTKPVEVTKLQSRVFELISDAAHRREALSLERELIENYQFEGIIGRSPVMLDVFSRIRRVAPHFRVLLIHGETGSGKELVARAIHNCSPRAKKPFVACNCSALVDTLLETELFGYVKGAFTGADRDKPGLFEYANGGTVFLDEIGEMPFGAQAKLLRVLQNAEIQRVGSPRVYAVDTRVIAATNRNLRTMVAQGRFREDLYYRLAVAEINLPSLSRRMEDLPLLQRYFIEKYAREYNKDVHGLTRRAQSRLSAYPWPGNVRELENAIANACMLLEGTTIDVKDLPDSIMNAAITEISNNVVPLTMEKVQEKYLLDVLAHTGGNKAKAAEILDISRETVYSILARIAQRSAGTPRSEAQQPSSDIKLSIPKIDNNKLRKL
jgi:two-component system, NtrC family, response regulator HydG